MEDQPKGEDEVVSEEDFRQSQLVMEEIKRFLEDEYLLVSTPHNTSRG